MSESAQPAPGRRPVERFKPTSGLFFGYAGIGLAVFAVGYAALFVHSATGLRIALGAVFFGILVWVTQVRPRATVYGGDAGDPDAPGHVVLRNSLRDAHVPLARVDEVSIGQMLSLWVGDTRYVCIGIGSSLREDVKARRRRMLDDADLGTSRFSELRRRADLANLDERAVSYATFVVTRLEELVEQAKREHARRDTEPPAPRRVWAWPEAAALAVTGLAFVASLFV